MKKIVIGIASQQDIRARARAIARGEHRPASGEPKVWFTSMRSLAEVLSDDNRALLRVDPRGAAGFVEPPVRSDRPRTEQPVAHAQDHGALRPGRNAATGPAECARWSRQANP